MALEETGALSSAQCIGPFCNTQEVVLSIGLLSACPSHACLCLAAMISTNSCDGLAALQLSKATALQQSAFSQLLCVQSEQLTGALEASNAPWRPTLVPDIESELS